MPQRRNAIKALRINHTRRMHNLDIKTDLRKSIKKFVAVVNSKNKTEAQNQLKLIYKKIDKAAKRNIIHDNTAARRKSHFSRLVQAIK